MLTTNRWWAKIPSIWSTSLCR